MGHNRSLVNKKETQNQCTKISEEDALQAKQKKARGGKRRKEENRRKVKLKNIRECKQGKKQKTKWKYMKLNINQVNII